jgi:hypothetical protein
MPKQTSLFALSAVIESRKYKFLEQGGINNEDIAHTFFDVVGLLSFVSRDSISRTPANASA